MYRSLIIDDEILARDAIRAYLRDDPAISVTGEAANGTEAVIKILRHRPDLIFLDIQMPGLDGFGVLKEIWGHYQPHVVFTTAYEQYALRAFEVNAIDYLLKPFDEIRFQQALGRVQQRLRQRADPPLHQLVRNLLAEGAATPAGAYLPRILVKETGRMFLVRTEDISHFEAEGNYVTLHTAQRPYIFYESLSGLETRLDPAQFVRISRSHLVNLDYIAELETYFSGDYVAKLTTGHKLKWTRGYRDNLKAFLSRLE